MNVLEALCDATVLKINAIGIPCTFLIHSSIAKVFNEPKLYFAVQFPVIFMNDFLHCMGCTVELDLIATA